MPGGCVRLGEPAGEGPGHRTQVLALSPRRSSSWDERPTGNSWSRPTCSRLSIRPSGIRRWVAGSSRRPGIPAAPPRDQPPRRRPSFEWEFQVLASDRVNALCLPGGKVAVFAGLLRFVRNVDELASVMGQEMANILAHRRERVITEEVAALRLGGRLGNLDDARRRSLLGLLDAGAVQEGLSFNRYQESEADHIGVFPMTFAGTIQKRHGLLGADARHPPARSDCRRSFPTTRPTSPFAQLREWVPRRRSKEAYENGKMPLGEPVAAREDASRVGQRHHDRRWRPVRAATTNLPRGRVGMTVCPGREREAREKAIATAR